MIDKSRDVDERIVFSLEIIFSLKPRLTSFPSKMSAGHGTNWVPLESNPEVLTRFAHFLGLPMTWGFSDVWSCDPDLLAMVPSPRLAVLFLFPLTRSIVEASQRRQAPPVESSSAAPYFCRQTIRNACGTIALLHASLNADSELVQYPSGSFFADFLARTRDLSPQDRAELLHEEKSLDEAHATFAAQGQTSAPAADDDVDLHFVAFVHHAGILYELDGRRDNPISHGQSKRENLLQHSCSVIKSHYMAADPNEEKFTILALTPVQQD